MKTKVLQTFSSCWIVSIFLCGKEPEIEMLTVISQAIITDKMITTKQ